MTTEASLSTITDEERAARTESYASPLIDALPLTDKDPIVVASAIGVIATAMASSVRVRPEEMIAVAAQAALGIVSGELLDD